MQACGRVARCGAAGQGRALAPWVGAFRVEVAFPPAPPPACRPKKQTSNAVAAFFARCPDNAFQRVPPGLEPFTLAQRFGAILRNGSKLLAVGFCASLLGEPPCWHEGRGAEAKKGAKRGAGGPGRPPRRPCWRAAAASRADCAQPWAHRHTHTSTLPGDVNVLSTLARVVRPVAGVGITNTLVAVRQMVDPGWAPPNKPQDVLQTSAAYGVYMSVSSNLRYQVIAGVIEERGIETIFKGQHQLCHALSFIVRTANTFVGSLLWVDFVRLMGMQKAQDPAPPPPALPAPAAKGGRGKK